MAALFYGYEYFLRIMPGAMSHVLMQAFETDAAKFGFLSACFYYTYTPMQLFVGVLLDRFGARKLLILAVLLCVLGTFLFTSHSFAILAISRCLIGFGSAFAYVGAIQLAALWLSPNQFVYSTGFINILGSMGAIGANFILVILSQYMGWLATIHYAAIIGVVLMIIMLFVVYDRPAVKIGCENHQANNANNHCPTTLADIYQGLIACLTHVQFWLAGIIGALLYLSLSAFAELWGNNYLMHVYHLSPLLSSFGRSCIYVGWIAGSAVLGFVTKQLKSHRLVLNCGAFFACLVIAAIVFYPYWSNTTLFIGLFLFGFFSSSEILIFIISVALSEKKLYATALSIVNMMIMLGGVIFQPAIGLLLDYHWHGAIVNHMRLYSVANYQMAMSVLPIVMFIAWLLSFCLKETFEF